MNLAMANIRKSKSASVSLFIFIFIAALLLNIGLMVITQINPFFDHKADQLNDPHVTFIMDQASYNSTYGRIFNKLSWGNKRQKQKRLSRWTLLNLILVTVN